MIRAYPRSGPNTWQACLIVRDPDVQGVFSFGGFEAAYLALARGSGGHEGAPTRELFANTP
eukprot:14838036-Alexandrium_andersonii.AAC.1